MAHSTEHHSATQQHKLDELISEAYAATGILPTIDDCRRLNEQLRAAIKELADEVRRRRDQMPARSRDWYRCDRLLADTGPLLAEDMGAGLLSAAMHVAELGRHCQMLRDCIREAR
ncbi:DUF6415 family natural product biosynthesis protein [Streptomyces sp. NPDC088794]|uniref:DUF6415 family natural product biosynthesis protein n=1 Tax=Streptomyces sp. NPDC088794 TaxID=3365902 RepID=UPI003800E015